MDIVKISNALSSEKRLKIISLLAEEDQTAVELFKKFSITYDNKAHRESVYRDLEVLHISGLVSKKYDSTRKKFYYHLKTPEININLKTQQVIASV